MENYYLKNGLVFWTQEEIKLRKMLEDYFSSEIIKSLKSQNSAFQMVQVEAPLLTPKEFINKSYTKEDMWCFDDVVLRPETTMGSYEYAKHLLSGFNDIKYKAPIVVWQHGKSFRREQDQPTKFMRLKEFYQLEFQIIFSEKTANDYSVQLYPYIHSAISNMIGYCRIEHSDRLPDYSEETIDIVCEKTNMEVCSMSKRKDFNGYKVIEVAIGTDRCIYNFNMKNNS
jgi:glycyl-tRNA synthetase